ncbi:hypothetical protein D3C80_1868000 [compost metagenome]
MLNNDRNFKAVYSNQTLPNPRPTKAPASGIRRSFSSSQLEAMPALLAIVGLYNLSAQIAIAVIAPVRRHR